MAGRRVRRVPRALALRLVLGLGLALALSAPARAQAGADYASILGTLARSDLAPERVEEHLHAALTTLERRGPGDADAARARFAAELALRVRAGEGSDAFVREVYAAIPGEELRTYTVFELANAHVLATRYAEAGALARFGLDEVTPAPTMAPRLWHVRAEAARLRGLWPEWEECLAGMERSIPPDSAYDGHPNAVRLVAQNRGYRSRLAQGRVQLWMSLGLLDRCRAMVAESLAEAEAAGEPDVLAAARFLAADWALVRGDAAQSVEWAREACADARLAPWHSGLRLVEGTAELARVRTAVFAGRDGFESAERARAALRDARKSGALVQRLKAELALGELELVAARFAEAGEHVAKARELLARSGAGEGEEALRLAVVAWRLARESGSDETPRLRAELFDAYARFLGLWAETPRPPGGIGFLHQAWRSQLVSDVLDAELDAAPGISGVERAFARLLAAQAMGTSAREHGLARATLEEVRAELLGEKRGLLVFLLARDRGHLFVLDARALEHFAIRHDRYTLRDEVLEVARPLQDPAIPVSREAIARLHRDLLPAGARARLASWSGAFVVGLEVLDNLPFGLLGAEEEKPLGARLALASLPSVPSGLELARRARAPRRGEADVVLVVANDPDPEFRLSPFAFGEEERRRLLDPFGERVQLRAGPQCGRGSLLASAQAIGEARVLHFLAHGTVLAGSGPCAALALSASAPPGERTLDAQDARRLGFSGLVILSTCNAGRGPARTGDDRDASLGGAFLEAGARCVIQTRYPVEYGATLALMERLHARLAAGDSPAEALRASRASLGGREAESVSAATFEVVGLGFEPVFTH